MDSQEIRMILASKLHEYRIRNGLTAKEAGDAVGKSEKTISAWEHGRGQPDADMLFKLCALYKIESFDVFYGRDNEKSEASLSSEELELVSMYRSFNNEGRILVMNTIRTFAGNPAMQKEKQNGLAM